MFFSDIPCTYATARTRQSSQSRCAQPQTQPRAQTPRLPLPVPPSSASLSPRDRSPTPPRTLSDQVHIAYADDDIHLAKVLLLRLQGIEVTSDSDPRIAAVRDEDFDACFIPFGRLDDGRGEQAVPKHVPPPNVRRADALRAKERLWETEARRFTEERCRQAALKRRQSDHQRAVSMEQDRLRLIKQKEAAAAAVDLRRRRIKPTARTLNFALVPPVPQPPPKFTYDFPFTPRNIAPRTAAAPRRSPQPTEPEPETREPNRVTFAQVLASMDGPLFPVLPCEQTLSTSADRSKARRQRALLDALLVAGVDIELTVKGKGRAIPPPRCTGCSPRAASPVSASTSTSSSGLSRAGSWLSFSSRSSRSSVASTSTAASSWASASTILSSPADSPPPPKSPPLRLSVSTWLPGARRTTSPSPSLHAHACRCRDAPRALVALHPLVPPDPPRAQPPARKLPAAHDHPQGAPIPFTLTLGRLAALARNLQTAYVRAVVVGYGGVSPEWDTEGEEEYNTHAEKQQPAFTPPPVPLASKLRVRAMGTRALQADVRRFLSPTPSPSPVPSTTADADADLAPHARLSPLAASLRACYTRPPARTPLPAHLPYRLVFAPPKPLPRSPWAPGAGPLPPTVGPVPCSAAKALERARARREGVGDSPTSSSTSAVAATSGTTTTTTTADLSPDSDADAHADLSPDTDTWARAPVLRARAVPNSAFLRVKALHNEAALHTHAHVSYTHNDAYMHGLSQTHDDARQVQHVRRPRECVVGLGVDYAPGSGLRFVYADAGGV
ncbi:hypothetical protein B0H13DRAFT_852298 [Mycena leptocephala]|nr:hypothetical protein B0H13DRAFT_852298 [Mycena leptocephala]